MLPKKERLKRQEFNQFFSTGKRIHTGAFTLIFSPYPALHASVVVPKKVAKSAVLRNKIRRRAYDIVRRYRSGQQVHGIFIFLAKSGVQKLPYATLKEEIEKGMKLAIQKFNG